MLYGDEYSNAELKDVAEDLRTVLKLATDVGKVELFAPQEETIYIDLNRVRMASLGITRQRIAEQLVNQNVVTNAGRIAAGGDTWLPITVTGGNRSIEDLEMLLINKPDSPLQTIRLRDVATVTRTYADPAASKIYYDGHLGIGIGISTAKGGNAVVMGDACNEVLAQNMHLIPAGVDIGIVSHQANAVTAAINGFTSNLIEAVLIVVAVLAVFMGIRPAIIIGIVLLVTILGTFIGMQAWSVALERISLGALVSHSGCWLLTPS